MHELEQDCERFRAVASLRLDGELTRLEAARHADHATRCQECRAFASELVAITARIRTAPAEVLAAPIPLGMAPPPRTGWRIRALAQVATALAIVLLGASGREDSGERLAQPRLDFAYFQSMDYERRLLRELSHRLPRRSTRVEGIARN